MTATDPLAAIALHVFVPPAHNAGERGGCAGCPAGPPLTAVEHAEHVRSLVQPLMEAREREVMASTAAEILTVIHLLADKLARLPDQFPTIAQGLLDFELLARAQFGVDRTDLATAGYQIVCDQEGCAARITGATIEIGRALAAAAGWDTAIGGARPARLTDLCPVHRAPSAP